MNLVGHVIKSWEAQRSRTNQINRPMYELLTCILLVHIYVWESQINQNS